MIFVFLFSSPLMATQDSCYAEFLRYFIRSNEIESVVEIGCESCSLSDEMEVRYLGIDPSEERVQERQRALGSLTARFVCGTLGQIDLPKSDLLICSDIFQEASEGELAALLEQMGKFNHCLLAHSSILPESFPDGTDLSFGAGERLFHIRNEPTFDGKRVCIAILARNKAHTLPHYLKCIESLDYDKQLIDIYINTNNNLDSTKEILQEWMKEHREEYRSITLEGRDVEEKLSVSPHAWSVPRLKLLGGIRNRSLQFAKEAGCDYYFVVDCDNFIKPYTLSELIERDKPIIAPLLTSVPMTFDPYGNFFADVTKAGYYKEHPDYFNIYLRRKVGTFKVPVVHCTYLIQSAYFDRLNYVDESDLHEFVIFSNGARKHNIGQYICNEREFGCLWHPNSTDPTLEEEVASFALFFTPE